MTHVPESLEVTDEGIYRLLKQYQEMGIIQYVGATEPLGEHWTVGYDAKNVKFTTREGIVGFIAGVQAFAVFSETQNDPE